MKKVFLSFIFFLLSGCSSLLFHPEKELEFDPSRLGLPYENVTLKTPDGLNLHAWFIPAYSDEAKAPPAKGTILFLHGNAGNISSHAFGVLWIVLKGYNLMALDYRGFGKSEGKASMAGAETDIQTALKYLTEKYPGQTLFVFGQSIGGTLAVSAVAKSPYQDRINGVIIDSAFSSTHRIAREKIAQIWLLWPFQYPLSFLVEGHSAETDVPAVTVPKLFITTEDDMIVPAHHTRILYKKAKAPKEMKVIPAGGHIRALLDPEVKQTFLNFLEQHQNEKSGQ